MATQDIRRRRSIEIPEVPAYDPSSSPPAAATAAAGPQTAGQRLRDAIRRTPGEIAGYARDVARNPGRELATATAPLVGSRALSSLGALGTRLSAANAARTAPGGLPMAARAAARPSAGQVLGTTASTAGAAGALAAVDSAQVAAQQQSQGGRAWKPGDPVPVIEASDLPSRPGERNTFTGSNGVTRRVRPAEAADPGPERVVADPNTAPEVRGLARRAVGDINSNAESARGRISSALLNPAGNDAELLRRMYGDMRFYGRGSPSTRRAIAEIYGAQLGAANEATLSGARTGNETFAQGADNAARANEAFADRRQRAAQFNVETAETRRQRDAENILEAASIAAGVRRRGGSGAAAKDPDQAFVTRLYQDYLKAGYDPTEAAERASRAAVDAGLPVDDFPETRLGATRRADRLYEGTVQHANKWFGWGPSSDFDYETAEPHAQTWGQGVIAGLLPGGEDAGDIRWRDAAGNVAITPSWALAGETPAQARLRLRRERIARGEE